MIELERRQFLQAGLAAGALTTAPGLAASEAVPSPRRMVVLHDGWRFHLGHASDMARDFGFGRNQRTFAKAGAQTADAAMPEFDDKGWQAVRVPHDWAVDLPYAPPAVPAPKDGEDAVAAHGFKAIGRDHPENSIGWYRRAIDVGPQDRDRALWLEFDGVFRDCIVFVNGYVAGGSASGYAPFGVAIGDFLDYDGGHNVIALRVDASLGEGWFYEGAGLYRTVTLVSAAALHVPQWGVCVRAERVGGTARVLVSAQIANRSLRPAAAAVRHRIIAPDGSLSTRTAALPTEIAAQGEDSVEAVAAIASPRLWSIETPQLYRVVTEILVGDTVVDRVETPFGIRTIAFDADRGFFLNGQPVKLLVFDKLLDEKHGKTDPGNRQQVTAPWLVSRPVQAASRDDQRLGHRACPRDTGEPRRTTMLRRSVPP